MEGISEYKSLDSLPDDLKQRLVDADKINMQGIEDVVLKVIVRERVPVILSYNKQQILCTLMAYDPRFRTKFFKELTGQGRIFVIYSKYPKNFIILPKKFKSLLTKEVRRAGINAIEQTEEDEDIDDDWED